MIAVHGGDVEALRLLVLPAIDRCVLDDAVQEEPQLIEQLDRKDIAMLPLQCEVHEADGAEDLRMQVLVHEASAILRHGIDVGVDAIAHLVRVDLDLARDVQLARGGAMDRPGQLDVDVLAHPHRHTDAGASKSPR